MTGSPYAVILFHTSNHAFRTETLLKEAGVSSRLIPVPRHLSSDCGVCARIAGAAKLEVEALLRETSVPIAGIHDL